MTPLLSIRSLKKSFPVYKGLFSRISGQVKAVDNVSLDIKEGETLGLVGESGCGKTTLGRMSICLIKPTSGEIYINGKDILKMSSANLKELRPKIQIIFQDPYSSLNPRFSVEQIIGEAMIVHGLADRFNLKVKISEIKACKHNTPTYKK